MLSQQQMSSECQHCTTVKCSSSTRECSSSKGKCLSSVSECWCWWRHISTLKSCHQVVLLLSIQTGRSYPCDHQYKRRQSREWRCKFRSAHIILITNGSQLCSYQHDHWIIIVNDHLVPYCRSDQWSGRSDPRGEGCWSCLVRRGLAETPAMKTLWK